MVAREQERPSSAVCGEEEKEEEPSMHDIQNNNDDDDDQDSSLMEKMVVTLDAEADDQDVEAVKEEAEENGEEGEDKPKKKKKKTVPADAPWKDRMWEGTNEASCGRIATMLPVSEKYSYNFSRFLFLLRQSSLYFGHWV